MLEFWKRKEKLTAMKWGMLDFEARERDRADFEGELITSFIDGSQTRYSSKASATQKDLFMALQFGTLLVLAVAIIAIVTSIYIIRDKLTPRFGFANAQSLASVINAIQVRRRTTHYAF